MNYGLIHVEPKPEDYHSEGRYRLAGGPLQLSGQWDDFLPPDELQAQYTETSACVTFATLNCVEILERRIHGEARDWSDRFLAKLSNTTPQGNDPQKVSEVLRKEGCVIQDVWPYLPEHNTFDKFYSPIPYEIEVLAQAQFKGDYNFGHQWVATDPQSMKTALQRSPLAVDVQAWSKGEDYYYRAGPSTHLTVIYGYVPGRYWKCLDTYDNTHKKLKWDYGFTMVKEFTLDKRVLDTSPWGRAVTWLRQFFVWK